MATIINNPNSFIQFNGGGSIEIDAEVGAIPCGACIPEGDPCLPIHALEDIAFQLRITGASEGFIDDIALGITINGCPVGPVDVDDFIEERGGNRYELEDGSTVIVFDFAVFEGPLPVLCDTLDDGDCITFVLFNISTQANYGCSQCLIFRRDTCYTARVKYRCSENSFGFYYEEQILSGYTQFFNRARLYLTINSPQFPSDREVFTLSDGTKLKLAEVIEEESDVLTEYYGKQWHRAMKVAISHDLFYVYDDLLETYNELHGDTDYDIDWVDSPGHYTGQGQAKFKLKTTPFYNENMNC